MNVDKIKLWWFNDNNFGDQIGPYLVHKLTGKKVVYVEHLRLKTDNFFLLIRQLVALIFRNGFITSFRILYQTLIVNKLFCVGSIIHRANYTCHVWGSGLIEEKDSIHTRNVYAVRGPVTKSKISNSINSNIAVGDPAILLPLVYNSPKSLKYKVGIIPHVVDYDNVVSRVYNKSILIIDIKTKDVEKIIDEICSCDVIVSSSLHGLIVAHAYRIPALWFSFSDKLVGDNVKFRDYFLSVGLPLYTAFSYESVNLSSIEGVCSFFSKRRCYSLPSGKILIERSNDLIAKAPFDILEDKLRLLKNLIEEKCYENHRFN